MEGIMEKGSKLNRYLLQPARRLVCFCAGEGVGRFDEMREEGEIQKHSNTIKKMTRKKQVEIDG